MIDIFNANTIDPGLTSETVAKLAVPVVEPAILDLRTFCTPIQADYLKPQQKQLIADVVSASATQTNPTSYEQSDFELGTLEVTPTLFSQQWGFNSVQMNILGHDPRTVIRSHAIKLCETVQQTVFAPMTASNYGDATTKAASSFALADFETVLTSVSNRTVVALHTDYACLVKSTWLPSHQPNLVREVSSFTGAESNTAGFAARPEAVALVYGKPHNIPRGEAKVSMIDLPNGLKARLAIWMNIAARSMWGSIDIVVGVAKAKSTALRLLKSA